MIRRVAAVLVALAGTVASAAAQPPTGDPPSTRQEALRRVRADKANQVTGYVAGALERGLIAVENERLLERFTGASTGIYAKYGGITSGGGFAVGPGYRARGLADGRVDVTAHALISVRRYWIVGGAVAMPRLVGGRAFIKVDAWRRDFPEEDFFGLGPASRRDDRLGFAYRDVTLGGSAGLVLIPRLTVDAGVTFISPSIGAGRDGQFPSIEQVFAPAQAPGLASQPDFLRTTLTADLNYAAPPGNPRDGGRYTLSYSRYQDRDDGRHDFGRLDLEGKHYFSILKNRRVLALRALVSLTDVGAGRTVPFYFQRTLGGSNTLRGLHEYRLRDLNLLLLQAEYRWEIWPALDAAIFYDAGKVAPTRRGLDLRDLETDLGVGLRFGTNQGVFMRIDAAFRGEGTRFYLKFGNVF